jgi:hypothetical protein
MASSGHFGSVSLISWNQTNDRVIGRERKEMKEYLGDSVYANNDCGVLMLTTENGNGPSNCIVIEPEVWEALLRFVEKNKA